MAAFSNYPLILLIASTLCLPVTKSVCNPCIPLTNIQTNNLTERSDRGITEYVVLNSLAELFITLNSTYSFQSRDLTVALEGDVERLNCPNPNKRKKWVICVYNVISEAIRNVTDNEIYSSTIDNNRIIQQTRGVLCYLRLVLGRTSASPRSLRRSLSNDICSVQKRETRVTPSPEDFIYKLLHPLRVATSLVMSMHETVLKNGIIRKLSRRRGYRRSRRHNKCKKGKNRKHRIRGCKKNHGKRRRQRTKIPRRNRKNKQV